MREATIMVACKGNIFTRIYNKSKVTQKLNELKFYKIMEGFDENSIRALYSYGQNSYFEVDRKNSDNMVDGYKADVIASLYDEIPKIRELGRDLEKIKGVQTVKILISASDFKSPTNKI